MYHEKDLTFAIPAYGESPYLETCIKSLMRQSVPCRIVITTSTPNHFIQRLSKRYQLPLYIREKDPTTSSIDEKKNSIANDWNYAYKCADTQLVTLAHQDDIYHKQYAETVLSYLNKASHPLIAFTDYSELHGQERTNRNRMLVIKRTLLSPLLIRPLWSSVFVRRRILSFGSAICCPSITYTKNHLPETVFLSGFRSNLDWQAEERLSRIQGEFVFCPHNLVTHRIHKDSTTTAIIADAGRSGEDLAMFQKFWPKPIASLICRFYQSGELLNNV